MFKTIVSAVFVCVIGTGCGTFADPGVEVLAGLVGVGLLEDDNDGMDGDAGQPGLNCWDLNGDGACNEETEDWNGPDAEPDGKCDAWDCQGIAGIGGSDGEAGAQGPPGSVGETGPVGIGGETGEPGIDGVDGADGSDGAPGATGPQGPVGPQGPQGIPGDGSEDPPVDSAVAVCHNVDNNPQTIHVAPPAVPAHLAHGDTPGECDLP